MKSQITFLFAVKMIIEGTFTFIITSLEWKKKVFGEIKVGRLGLTDG